MAKRSKGADIPASDPIDEATNGLAILARMMARKHLRLQRERFDNRDKNSSPPTHKTSK